MTPSHCTEVWKPIPSLKGWYEASSLGRIRRIKPAKKVVVGRIVSPTRTPKGYLIVYPTMKCKKYSSTVHRLVAECFIGPRPPGLQINHKNGKKDDNRVENLEYVTASENQLHAFRVLGLVKESCRGDRHYKSMLTSKRVRWLLSTKAKRGKSNAWMQSVAHKWGVSVATIHNATYRRSWKHVRP